MSKKPVNIQEAMHGRADVSDSPELVAYYKQLHKFGADALWTVANAIEPWQPKSPTIPMIWKYKDLRALVLKSADMVSPEKAGRRVVMLVNEGRVEASACVGWLYTGLQTMRPGEITSAHRHMASALRFIMEGQGAYTVVDGHKINLNARDFVLTPNDCWHDHGVREDGEQCIWQDGLDIPLMNVLDVNFYDVYPKSAQDALHPANDMPETWAGSGVLPDGFTWQHNYSPVMRFSFDKTYEALLNRAKIVDEKGDGFGGITMRYSNPTNGGHVMPTMSAYMQMLRAKESTRRYRRTGSYVFQVAKGKGYSIIGDQRFDWQEKDIFVIPSWVFFEHHNLDDKEDACLFCFNDLPVMEKLKVYYQESFEDYQKAIEKDYKSSYQGRFGAGTQTI